MNKSQSLHLKIPQLALKALMYEVSISPKPGLVDRFNNGSHNDMTFFTFVDSVLSFESYFKQYYELGRELSDSSDVTLLFSGSRTIGIQAEKSMFEATHGINTHKGANFSFALMLVAIGYMVERHHLTHWSESDTQDMFQLIQQMTQDILLKDFDDIHLKTQLSHGEKLFVQHGITGIRGEAVSGYPILRDTLMPFLRSFNTQLTEYDLLKGLLLVMGHIEDGNIIHRGGFSAWEQVKAESIDLFNEPLNQDEFLKAMHDFDAKLIDRHLSPGGAADALGLGIFLYFLENMSASIFTP